MAGVALKHLFLDIIYVNMTSGVKHNFYLNCKGCLQHLFMELPNKTHLYNFLCLQKFKPALSGNAICAFATFIIILFFTNI